MKEGELDKRIKKKSFSILNLFLTFAVFGILTTIQMVILGKYIDYINVSNKYKIMIITYWLIEAIVFVLITNYEINHRYEKPMKKFAEAAKKVANGDFSVYVPPIHRMDKLDYLDVMFLDFNKMVEELGSIETLKTDFISNVSHEIKTPIAVIQNYAKLLQEKELNLEERLEYAVTIEESARGLSTLITNILKLNKIENQRIQPMKASYDICRQLCECAIHFENIWEKKQIEFQAELEERAIIYADESLMELVWNNLLSNAFKFTEPFGKVILRQTSTSDEITVSVTDTGCGISEESINHIFDKFYQGDTSHSIEGNGLGLSLVLRVLQLFESSILVKSALDKGSTFTVKIPVKSNQKLEV